MSDCGCSRDASVYGPAIDYAREPPMTVLPETLRPAEPMARAVYQAGWRPTYAPGPTRDELVDVIRVAVPAA